MRSETETFGSSNGNRSCLVETLPLTKKAPASRKRRSAVISRILVDALSHPREYLERWKAGRGAE